MNSHICHAYKIILLLGLFWVLLGCQQTNATSSQSTTTVVETSTETVTETATISTIQETQMPTTSPTRDIVASPTPTEETVTLTQFPTLTPTQPEPSVFRTLPPAQYLVHGTSGSDGRFDITSLNGDFSRKFNTTIKASPGPSFSLDGRLMVFVSKENSKLNIYDWESSTLTDVLVEIECFYPSWSPDKTSIVASCGDRDQLYIIKPSDAIANTLQIWPPSSSESYVCTKRPKWSPNGRWIAFGQEADKHEILLEDGIYIINTTCLAEPEHCLETALGPFFQKAIPGGDFDLAWSPDSRYLAVSSHYPDPEIRIIDIENRTEKVLAELDSLEYIWGVSWSPDGEWVVFSAPSQIGEVSEVSVDIYKVSPWYAEPIIFIQDGWDVIDWFTIPHPANPGEKFMITQAGANLNLRASPSLSSDSLMKLQPEDIIIVLGGPIEAEGYVWWNLAIGDETEGWAVNIPEWYEPIK